MLARLSTTAARHLAPVGVLCALWGLFFWRVLIPNPLDRLIFADVDFVQHYYAFASYQVERLWEGQFPLWNPYNHAGDPFAGNIQFAAFYPPRFVGALLWGADGYSQANYQLEAILHVLLASLLMYAFLLHYASRRWLALVGSVLYAYSGYLTSYPLFQVSVIASAAWLPLLMLGVHRSVTVRGAAFNGVVIAAAAVALSLLGGHPQTTMYITYLGLIYLFMLGWQQKCRWWGLLGRFALLGGLSTSLSAVQLLPALEFARLSSRVVEYGFADKGNGFQLVELLHAFVPRVWTSISPLYVGVAGLLLALIGAARGAQMRWLWVGVVIVGLLVSLGANGFAYGLFYLVVPGFNVFRQQERIAVLISFALVMLAVEGLKWWRSAPVEQRQPFAWFAAGFSAVTGGLGLAAASGAPLPPDPFLFAALMGVLAFVWLRWGAANHAALALLLALIVVDLFTVNTQQSGYQPDRPEHRVQLAEPLADLPTRPADIRWRVDGAAGLQGYGTLFRIPDIYGTGPFTLASVEALRTIPVDRFWEVLSVRYVTTSDAVPAGVPMEQVGAALNFDGQPYQVYELLAPRPLAHLVYDSRDAGGSAEFARQIMADSRVNLREMAVTLHPLPINLPVERPDVSAIDELRMVTPERWEITASTSAPALLTLSLVYYPGWGATLDGQPVDTFDVNGGLTGLLLPAGEGQHIVIEYRPVSVALGAAISALGLMAWVVLTALSRRLSA
ncbi:YfhO family protein [Aggregatilineales bacterium SYSU G02658]